MTTGHQETVINANYEVATNAYHQVTGDVH